MIKKKFLLLFPENLSLNQLKKNINLKKFDAICIFSDNYDYNFEGKKNTEFYIVSSEKFKKRKISLFSLILKKILRKLIFGAVNVYQGLTQAST